MIEDIKSEIRDIYRRIEPDTKRSDMREIQKLENFKDDLQSELEDRNNRKY